TKLPNLSATDEHRCLLLRSQAHARRVDFDVLIRAGPAIFRAASNLLTSSKLPSTSSGSMPSNSIAHRIPTSFDTTFQRYYAVEAPDLRRLYENAKRDQWNASSDIDWTIEVDPARGIFADELIDGHGTPTLDRLEPSEFQRLNVEFSCWRLSQLLHGEEGAMLACSQLVDMVPGNDAKFFQATQVVDEARHAEV